MHMIEKRKVLVSKLPRRALLHVLERQLPSSTVQVPSALLRVEAFVEATKLKNVLEVKRSRLVAIEDLAKKKDILE